MPLPDGSFLLFSLGGFAVFLLWNLYHFGQAFGKKTFGVSIGVTVAVLAAGFMYLQWRQQRTWLEKRASLLIFPAVAKSDGPRLEANGLAIAEMTGEYLRQTANLPFYLIPTETVFAAAQRDSLIYNEYVVRFARAAGLSIIVFGGYRQAAAATNHHDEWTGDFKLFDLRKKNISAETALNLPKSFTSLPELARAIAQNLASAGASTPARIWQNQVNAADLQKYYAAKFDLLRDRTEAALAAARRLALADTSQENFAGLYVASFLRHYQHHAMHQTLWADSLRFILPAAKHAAARDSVCSGSARRLGEVYLSLKKWNEAENALRLARGRDSTDSKIYLRLAQLHASRWRLLGFRSELELYQRARAFNPLDLEAGLLEADYQWRENHPAPAVEILEHWLRLNPNQVEVLMSLARVKPPANDDPQNLAVYKRILALAPDNAEAYFNLGIVYYHQEDFDNAGKFFERAIQLNNHADARLYLASLAERRGNLELAIQYLRERIRLSRGDDDRYAEVARNQLYNILLARGEIPAQLRPDSLK